MRPLGVKVIAGVLVLRSARAVDFINDRLAGLMVPDEIGARIKGASDAAAEAVALATEQVRAIREVADGVHIMTLGLDAAVPEILGGAGLLS